MYQRPPVPLPEVATDMLIQRVIVEQLVQFFEHWIDALCHLRHSRKHIFCFIEVYKHPAFLLHAVRACFLLSFLHVACSERASQAHFAPQTSTSCSCSSLCNWLLGTSGATLHLDSSQCSTGGSTLARCP